MPGGARPEGSAGRTLTSPQEDSLPRLREDDRETAVQRLQKAYAEERISHEEMDERLGRVPTAKTHKELASALAALPAEDPDTTSTIAAAGGRIQRRGAWQVPRILKGESAYGRVRLDLSRAVIDHPVVDIELRRGTGGARITVPLDAVVDVEGLRTGWEGPALQDPAAFPPRRAENQDLRDDAARVNAARLPWSRQCMPEKAMRPHKTGGHG